MKITTNGLEYYIDGYLYENLNRAREVIKKDWDMIFCVDGYEGSGKSVLAQQMAAMVDEAFDIKRICFTPSQFKKAIYSANKFQAIIYDEGYSGLSSRATMSMINRTLVSMLTEIRERNLFVFVVMPCFFDFDKYVALWRSRALIHIYTGDNFQRGYFAFYNADRKKDLYIKGKKFYSYAFPKPNFIGRFTNFYTVDQSAYRALKRAAGSERAKKEEEAAARREIENQMFMMLQNEKINITHEVKMKILDMSPATYYRKLKQNEEMREFL